MTVSSSESDVHIKKETEFLLSVYIYKTREKD